jgi:hypothetical protein
MRYFRYIDAVRDSSGKLRNWDEYETIARFERKISEGAEHVSYITDYFKFKDMILNEERNRVQKSN